MIMSVESARQNRTNGSSDGDSPREDTSPLNLTQFQRRNGRKRSTPQKSVMMEEYGENDSESDDTFHEEASNGDDKATNHVNGLEEISEETREKAKSILDHYRSFIQRNSTDLSDALSKIPSKKMKLMKTSSLSNELTDEGSAWNSFSNYKNGGEPLTFEPVVNGPVSGPNGLIPERTMRQNNWAIKVWRDWALSRNRQPETKLERFSEVPVDIRVADIEVMSYWLPKFIKEVRRKDKKPYPADTLMQIASGLQRYLRQVSCRSEVNFFDKYSSTFAEFRDALKTRSGELSAEVQTNKTGKKIQVDNLNDDELWLSGYLNCSTAKGIFHVVFYYNCVEFEITSMEEHHELKVEQFSIGLDKAKNEEYLEFRRSDQRYYNMSTKQIMRRYAAPSDPRCLVKLYKAYLDLVQSTGPFYRRPLQTPENSSPRFSFNPVGINKLRETYKQLFSPDRPASLRRSGKTNTIRHISQQSSDQEPHTPPPPTIQPPTSASQAVYDAITQKLKNSGHLRSVGDDAVDLSVKTSDSFESDDEHQSLGAENVMEQIRKSWLSARKSDDAHDRKSETDADDVLTVKVPRYVKYVVIERDGKKMKFDLN